MQAKLQDGQVELNSTDELLENVKAPIPDVEVSNSLCSDTADAMTVIDGRQGDNYGTVWQQDFFSWCFSIQYSRDLETSLHVGIRDP